MSPLFVQYRMCGVNSLYNHEYYVSIFRDGKSRCFGFVGFAQDSDAQAAQKYYNKTFMDAMRLEVEFAQKYGSELKKNAWSKYTEGTSRNKEFMAATGANAVKVATAGPKETRDGRVPTGQITRQGRIHECC